MDGGHGPLKFHYNLDCLFNHGVYIAILSSERYNLVDSDKRDACPISEFFNCCFILLLLIYYGEVIRSNALYN